MPTKKKTHTHITLTTHKQSLKDPKILSESRKERLRERERESSRGGKILYE